MAESTTMSYSRLMTVPRREEFAGRITVCGLGVLRYGLAVVIGWIGMMKFTY